MNRNRQEKGITLIALIITIVVLLILAELSIATLTGEYGILTQAQNAKEKTEKAQQEELDILKKLEEQAKNNGADISGFNEEKGVNKPIDNSSLNNGEQIENSKKGIIPVYYESDAWVVCMPDDEKWYNYSNEAVTATDGTKIEAMRWANGMLRDGLKVEGITDASTATIAEMAGKKVITEGSMFVWIPRYAYSMTKYKTEIEGTADTDNGTTQDITKVEFLKGSSNIGTTGKIYGTNYDESKVTKATETPMIVHPAFTFGGKELKGIWVAKFEASMLEENTNTTTENDTNALEKTVKIVPNAESWRYITLGQIFKVCLNMKDKDIYKLEENTNTHQMKNSEWGAVAYLAASQYGTVPAKNESGVYETKDIFHSFSAEGDYKTNINQSTTGNVSGIYDMNGGAWEYLAAYWDNEYTDLSEYGGNIFTGNKIDEKYVSYFDKYEVSEDELRNGVSIWESPASIENNLALANMAYKRIQLTKGIKGNAMYEVMKDNEFAFIAGTPQEKLICSAEFDEDGIATSCVEHKELDYPHGLYGEDINLIGSAGLPFVIRRRGGKFADTRILVSLALII